MRRSVLVAVGLVGVVLGGGLVVWPRIESLCVIGGPATELAVRDGKVSIEGRTYLVESYASADYGAYIFPGGFLRGHPVAVGVYIRGADDAALPEVSPSCVGIQHGQETIERRARTAVRTESRSDGSPYIEVSSGIADLPEWKPGDGVRVWVRLTVKGQRYVIAVGDTTINSVA
jgi:hypothetical protein